MKLNHFKQALQDPFTILAIIPALIYSFVFLTVSYRLFGVENILFYASFFLLLPALFWGFLDESRAVTSLIIMFLVLIHFLLGGKFAFVLFILLPLVFVNLRDWGIGAIIIMILINISLFLYPEKLKSSNSLETNIKDISYAMFRYPDYKIKTEYPIKIMLDMAFQKYSFQLRKKHIKFLEDKEKYILVDGFENSSHPDYNKSKKLVLVANILYQEILEENKQKVK